MKNKAIRSFLTVLLAFTMMLAFVPNLAVEVRADMVEMRAEVQTDAVTPTEVIPNENAVTINAAGGTNYSLFNSGATGNGRHYNYNYNYDEASYSNGGYDLYANQGDSNEVIQLGLPFTVEIDIQENATVNIYAYDVDEYDTYHGHNGDERDYIYLVNETTGTRTKLDGYLSGQNVTWNTTSLTVPHELLASGNTYHFELDVNCTCNCGTYWVVYVRTVNLLVNGSIEPPLQQQTGIENADLSASISSSGYVSVNVSANAYLEADYTLEYKAVCNSNNAQYGGYEYNVTIPTATATFSTGFQLESDAPRGTYTITVFFKDAQGNVVATRTAAAGRDYSAVSYNANGGSQNLPTDTSMYSAGDTVNVKFDTVPSRYGFTFLGWSTNSNASLPTYTIIGSKSFVISDEDVTLYAVWMPNIVTIDGVELYLTPEILATQSTITGSMDREVLEDGDGTRFVRVDNLVVNADNWAAGSYHYNGTFETGQYMVIKLRIGENGLNQSSLMMLASTASGLYSGMITYVKVSEDNEWHTIVIDLSQRVADPANYFAPDENGAYCMRTLQIRPFSNAQTRAEADDYMDIAYIAFCNELDDIKNVIEETTYEWSVGSSTSAIRYTADHSCAQHLYTEVISGTTHSAVCSICGEVHSTFEVPESINWYSPLADMNKYQHNLEKLLYDEEAGVFFNRYTGTGGNHLNITGGSGQGRFTNLEYSTGQYIVFKYRATMTDSLSMYAGTYDNNENTSQPMSTSLRLGSNNNLSSDWCVAVIQIPDNEYYTKDSVQQLYFMFITSGEYTFDIAYMAVVDDLDEMALLVTDETYMYYGTSFANEGELRYTHAAHEHNYVNTTVVEPTCTDNGYTIYECACGDSYIDDYTENLGHGYSFLSCNRCGESIQIDITANSSATVNIDVKYGAVFFVFTPTESGTYWFYSSYENFTDPYITLFDENGNELTWDDDGGDDRNFRLSYYCEANTTYYIKAHMWSTYIGSYTITVDNTECVHEYYVETQVDPTCTEDGYIIYVCSLCGISYEETLYSPGHSYMYPDPMDPPSCTEPYVEYYCTVCGLESIVPAPGHDFVDGTCSRCGIEENPDPEVDVWDGSIANGFGGGTGTETDPYLIYTGAQLAYLAQSTNGGNTYSGKYFKLMNDIDLNNIEWTPIGKDMLSGFSSDYSPTYTFAGTFDGNYRIIYNLSIESNDTSFAGLFGTTNGATVKNLAISGAHISNIVMLDQYRSKAGTLIGLSRSSSIENCAIFNANVIAEATEYPSSAGGLIGIVYGGTVKNSFAYANVSGNGHVSGLIGGNYYSNISPIENCYAMGTVTSTAYISNSVAKHLGGILAYNFYRSTVRNCVYIGSFNNSHGFSTYPIGNADSYNSYYHLTSGENNFDPSNFQSQAWIESNLGWDFDTVWTFGNSSEYPVLQGFRNVDPHIHTHVATTVVDPTCTEDGYTVYACESCGHTYNSDFILKLGHTPGEWIIDVEPTCTTSGLKHTECERCHEILENIYIPALGHNYVSEITREATCTEPGITTYTCTRCPDSYVVYVYSEHNMVLVGHEDATCEQDGYNEYACSRENCDYTYREIIPGGHDYIAEITTLPTATTEGLITYTCSICGNQYTEIIPARPMANVLLIQDRLPWDHNDNVVLLNRLLDGHYITGWDMTTTSAFHTVDLTDYSVILIANDQTTATYNRLAQISQELSDFANAGGVVIYGACDHGWASGDIGYTLPLGVQKDNFYSRYNYIVDSDNLIVTGTLTDNKALTNSLLNGTYCSHTYFNKSTLPVGTNIILEDAYGNPTLVEYAVGNGYVIASGLTWEFYYSRTSPSGSSNTYSKSVFDDLVVYAVYLSDSCEHIYDEGTVIAPTCTEQGCTLHTCINCGREFRDNFVDVIPHTPGEWAVEREATAEVAGLEVLRCTACQTVLETKVIPIPDAAQAKIESVDTVIIGQEIVFEIVIEDSSFVKSLAVVPQFDSDIFDFVGAEWVIAGATIQTIEPDTHRAAAAWANAIDPNGIVFRFTLRAKALTGATTVDATVMMQDDNGLITLTVIPKTVSVIECPHTNVTYLDAAEGYHISTCDLCGYSEVLSHTYDNCCDDTCNDCGHVRVAPHAFEEAWANDNSYHWHVCSECGAESEHHEHEYDDANDNVCNICGYVSYIPGDVDNDGDVDADDAIYLLYYVMFGAGDYPVNQPCDFNNDGNVDSDDACRLLYYTFYGAGDYPIIHH